MMVRVAGEGALPDRPVRLEHGDWHDLAGALEPGCVDLVYIDPPFNTGVARASPPNGAGRGREADASFGDAWPTMGAYVAWARERLVATLPALAPAANLLVHCDWRASHHLRLLLDDVLGPDRFVNHLVWSYGLGGSSGRRFPRKHDDILFYSRDPGACYFEPPMVPARSRRLAGRMKKMTDVLDVPSLNNMARERTGYPTQKPLALLELLVRACCPPGGVVLDPCCGSGTTIVAAVGLGRGAIGWDSNARAVDIARRRLREALTPA